MTLSLPAAATKPIIHNINHNDNNNNTTNNYDSSERNNRVRVLLVGCSEFHRLFFPNWNWAE